MNYNLATYGEDIVIEATGIDAASFQAIMETLPAPIRAQVIGYRQVASVTAGRAT